MKQRPGCGPPAEKSARRLLANRAVIKRMRISYHILDLVQSPFAYFFWILEQRKARLQDRLANEGSGL